MNFSVSDLLLRTLPGNSQSARVALPFFHSVTTTWDWSAFDPARSNDTPDLNLTVIGLVLSSNIENTFGKHEWDVIAGSLKRLGFVNIVHQYFEHDAKVNYPAMIFARSSEPVHGKYVVSAVFRGTTSFSDYISDIEAETFGFHKAGINTTNELSKYIREQGLSKENTILLLTGHSYGAAIASLVAIMSTELAERDSVFCYAYASPNYFRRGLTGNGMKMFCFANTEDIVPTIPVGFNLDKTGKVIYLNRPSIQSMDPNRYKRFLRLYMHFRDMDFDQDVEVPSQAHSLGPDALRPVEESVHRNHMPCTYMALILSDFSEEIIGSYLHMFSQIPEQIENLEWEICLGEMYKLPSCDKDEKHTELTWKCSDETIIEISDKGMFSGKCVGNAALSVTTEDGRCASIDVRVLED